MIRPGIDLAFAAYFNDLPRAALIRRKEKTRHAGVEQSTIQVQDTAHLRDRFRIPGRAVV